MHGLFLWKLCSVVISNYPTFLRLVIWNIFLFGVEVLFAAEISDQVDDKSDHSRIFEPEFMGPGASIFDDRSLMNRSRRESRGSLRKSDVIIDLNKIPDFLPPTNSGTVFSIDDFKERFRKESGAPAIIYADNEEYQSLNHHWFKKFYHWFDKNRRHSGLDYQAESWDCENFSQGVVSFSDLSAVKSGFTSIENLVGWIVVYYEKSWARMPAGVVHSIVIFQTEKGIHLLEPQNGWMVPLEDFPNKKHIQSIYLP